MLTLASRVVTTAGTSTPSTAARFSADTDATGREARSNASKIAAAVDRVLIARFNGGDLAAFDEIVARYRKRIRTLAGRFLRNDADAEEIAQDTFIRAYRGLSRFRGDSSLITWLHHITVNLARNRYAYIFRRRTHLTLSLDCPLSAESDGTFADLMPSDDADPAREAATSEFAVLVTECMAQLEKDQREILTLRNQLHHSYDQIARELCINEGTVKSRIARARGSLRDLMAAACPEFAAAASAREWLESTASRLTPGSLRAA